MIDKVYAIILYMSSILSAGDLRFKKCYYNDRKNVL